MPNKKCANSLLSSYRSAELTTCFLMRMGRDASAPDSLLNAYTILIFSPNPVPSERFNYLTDKSKRENSPSGKHRFVATRSFLDVSEATKIAECDGSFMDPQADGGPRPIAIPGVWKPLQFVGKEDAIEHACLPYISASFHLRERWQPTEALQDEVEAKGMEWLTAKIKTYLGLDLSQQTYRLGNLLVVYPENRAWTQVTTSREQERIGVEIRSKDPSLTEFALLLRASRGDDAPFFSAYHEVPPGLHVFPFPRSYGRRDIELYDRRTGCLLDRDRGDVVRSIHIDMHIVTAKVNGQLRMPDGEEIQVNTEWSQKSPIVINTTSEWEMEQRLELLHREQESALRSKRLLVYTGGSEERNRAVSDIKSILHEKVDTYLKLWDPYFTCKDAARFLLFVSDPATQIRILTGLRIPDQEKSLPSAPVSDDRPIGAEVATLNVEETKQKNLLSPKAVAKDELRHTLDALHRLGTGKRGLQNIACKIGGSAFHDRFLITKGKCWQLGCSFNQIGAVTSTIVEFPYPLLIEQLFDEAWGKASELVAYGSA